MEQRLVQAPRAIYRLTRAQIRLIRHRVEKRREAARQVEQAEQAQLGAETNAPARASPEISPEAASTFDDPAKRPLSAREIAKGRERRRAARQDTREPIPAEKGSSSRPSLPSSDASNSVKPHTRQEPTRILHEKPAPNIPKPRESFRQPVKTTQHVIERQPRQVIKTADAAARTAAQQSVNAAKKAGVKATERAAQTTARNAAKVAKHMADLAKRASRRTADALRRASQAAIRASIQAMRALVNLLISGGWVIVLIILVLLMCVSILASPFGIFTHTDANEFPDSITLDKAITTINAEYADEIRRLGGGRSDTLVAIEGNLEGGVEPVNWVDVLAVFSVHLTMREENAMDVVQLDKATAYSAGCVEDAKDAVLTDYARNLDFRFTSSHAENLSISMWRAGGTVFCQLTGIGAATSAPDATPEPEPMTTPLPEQPVQESQTMYVVNVTSYVNLRSKPSTNAKSLAQIPKGASVQSTGEKSGDFLQVIYDGKTGYAHGDYLSPNNPNPSMLTVVNCQSNVSLWAGPSTEADKLDVVPLGGEVESLGVTEDGFHKVKYGGKEGYIIASYLAESQQ